MLACAPAMLKWGNRREFGPEIDWLNAGIAAGHFSWPKIQLGVPFFPMLGPRLLVRKSPESKQLQQTLLRAILDYVRNKTPCTVFNIMNAEPTLIADMAPAHCLYSHEARAVWRNQNYCNYQDYLQTIASRKRYSLLKERNRKHLHELRFEVLTGAELPFGFWQDFYRGHAQVCRAHGNTPWLPYEFYSLLGEYLRGAIRVFAAFRGDQYIASALGFVDSEHLYMQTWSIVDDTPDLCFELLCHRPIEYAIAHQLQTIDSGLAAQHKVMRGFPAEPIANLHWFAQDALKNLAQTRLQQLAPVPTEVYD